MTAIRHRLRGRLLAAMGLAGALALGGCYDDGYGYGGVSVGTGYYGGGYYDPYYGSGYYPGGYGWYDGFYYPGSGYYVYDRGGRRQRWTDTQRRYWEARRGDRRPDGQWQGGAGRPRPDGSGNWQGRPRPDRDGNWQGRPRPDGNGAATPNRPPQGTDGTRGPGRWRGNDGDRPRMQPGLRDPQQARPQQARPQMNQPRPQRDWGGQRSSAPRGDRPMRSPGRDPAPRVQPN
jgi:hypothetical protein